MDKIESKMEKDYAHLLEIDYDKNYKINCVDPLDKVHVYGRNSLSLNGVWNFSPDVFDTFIRKEFFKEKYTDENKKRIPVDCSFDEWPEVILPCVFNNIKPEFSFYEGTFIFTRKFDFTKNKQTRVYLRIGAANYETRIWLNKELIGRHLGGFTPFFIEVTDLLKEKDNRISIMVNNERKIEQIPSINYDWFNYGGIFRDIELFELPESFISDLHIALVQDGMYNKIKVEIYRNGLSETNEITFEISELGVKESLEFKGNYAEVEITVNNLELWSVDNPKLYEVKIQYNCDSICDLVGFRQIEIKHNKFFLNGENIFLKGICVHEEFSDNGRMFDENDLEKIFVDLKDLGANFVRLTHYPHNEKVALMADKLGIMLWEEIPVYWALEFSNKETIDVSCSYIKELILRDRNRASVITWGIGNENPDTDERFSFLKTLYEICKSFDKNRLVTAACLVNIDQLKVIDRVAELIDFVSINEYYGWYYRNFDDLNTILENSVTNKPIVISETGGEAVYGKTGNIDELYTENCLQNIYKNQLEIILNNPIVQGLTPWILYDYKTMVRLNKYQNGVNLKGLITFDRKNKKKAFYTLQEFYKDK